MTQASVYYGKWSWCLLRTMNNVLPGSHLKYFFPSLRTVLLCERLVHCMPAKPSTTLSCPSLQGQYLRTVSSCEHKRLSVHIITNSSSLQFINLINTSVLTHSVSKVTPSFLSQGNDIEGCVWWFYSLLDLPGHQCRVWGICFLINIMHYC